MDQETGLTTSAGRIGSDGRPHSRSVQSGLGLRLPSPLEAVHDKVLAPKDMRLFLKRDDLIHPEIPGNKWRKLKYNVAAAAEQEHHTVLTFGGAYSNHIRATAAAGAHFGLATIGVIRGEEHLPLNPSLADAASRGMTLVYLDRMRYREKDGREVQEALRSKFGDFYLVPEGGSNEPGVRGCAEIPREIDVEFDVICCSCGTGGTLAGIAAGLQSPQRAIGFSALKGAEYLNSRVDDLQRRAFGFNSGNWTIEHAFHFGGFARRTPELDRFIGNFHAQHGVFLEWVYVAKMMHGIYTLIERGDVREGSTVVAVITG